MKNFSVVFNLVLSILSTQLFAHSHVPAEFQNNIQEPFVVKTADIGVPTIPPPTYQEKSYTLPFTAFGYNGTTIPVDIKAIKFGSKVVLSIKGVRFHTTSNDFFTLFRGYLPDLTFCPNTLTQLNYCPIVRENGITEYFSPGLVTISEVGTIMIYFNVPDSEKFWLQNETCGWNELTLTYTVIR